MKYIDKQIKNEPAALRLYKNNTPNANYNGYGDKLKDQAGKETYPLREALLKEQGYLCAYCMGRISLNLNEKYKPRVEVEHYKPQDTYPKLDLFYQNMLGVCNGLSLTYPEKKEMHHCDKTKGEEGKMNGKVELKKLNPCDKICESLITYRKDGQIVAVNDDTDVKHDLEQVLNLNNKALKEFRRDVLDNAKKKMTQEKPDKEWTKAFLRKHLDSWKSKNKNGEFRRHCMIVVWYIERRMSKIK